MNKAEELLIGLDEIDDADWMTLVRRDEKKIELIKQYALAFNKWIDKNIGFDKLMSMSYEEIYNDWIKE